ncbi:MAG: xylose isomerase [Spirochaetes bacterium]|nr:MAG: xylose isomerase [Spirochaetota bacterium]
MSLGEARPLGKIGVSLVGMKTLEALEAYLREIGPEARFELSYKMSESQLRGVRPHIERRVLSCHACCPSTDFFPNLASADPAVVRQSLKDMESTLATALDFGARIVILHAGYVTDSAMPSTYAARKALLSRPEFLKDIRHAEGAICGPDYCETPHYLRYAERAKERLAALARRYAEAGARLAVENLNPRVGYLFHTPREMAALAALDPDLWLCLDVGHLYISSFAYGFDFLGGVKEIVATGKVATCHIHANSSGPGIFRDDHESMDSPGFPLEEVLDILIPSGANLIVESVDDLGRNTRLLENARAQRRAKPLPIHPLPTQTRKTEPK